MVAFIEVTNSRGQKCIINPTHIRMVEALRDGVSGPATITFPGDDADSIMQTEESYNDVKLLISVVTRRPALTLTEAKEIQAKAEAEMAKWEAEQKVSHQPCSPIPLGKPTL
jgi:hypothetical protein